MKLLIVSQHFYPEPFRINDMAFSLVQMGHEVTVLTGLPNYPSGVIGADYKHHQKRDEWIQNVHVLRTPIIARGSSLIRMGLNYLSFALVGSLKALNMSEKFDAIFVFQTSPVSMILPGIMIQRKQHIPLIVYCLDQWPISVTTGPIAKGSLFYKFLYAMSHWHYKQADRILLSSASFVHYFEDYLRLSKQDYHLDYWPSYAEDIYGNSVSIDNNCFDVVFAGNVGPAQSVETLVEAANILKDQPTIHFHIVGDGLSLDTCKALANTYQLTNISFYGHHPVEAMKQYYDLADAFLITMVDNPVVNSTLPAKLQSYIRAAKPIIGAINGEVKRVVEDAHCGWICPSMDANALSQMILDASNQPNLVKQYGQNGLNYYHKHFDKKTQLDTLVQLIQETPYDAH